MIECDLEEKVNFRLRHVNKHIYNEFISFYDWESLEKYIIANSYSFKIDLKQGNHHIDIFPEHQTFFGLSSAPYIFTKCLRPLVTYWHSHGVQIALYLDDGACIEASFQQAEYYSLFVRNSLTNAGFIVNEETSEWIPSS